MMGLRGGLGRIGREVLDIVKYNFLCLETLLFINFLFVLI